MLIFIVHAATTNTPSEILKIPSSQNLHVSFRDQLERINQALISISERLKAIEIELQDIAKKLADIEVQLRKLTEALSEKTTSSPKHNEPGIPDLTIFQPQTGVIDVRPRFDNYAIYLLNENDISLTDGIDLPSISTPYVERDRGQGGTHNCLFVSIFAQAPTLIDKIFSLAAMEKSRNFNLFTDAKPLRQASMKALQNNLEKKAPFQAEPKHKESIMKIHIKEYADALKIQKVEGETDKIFHERIYKDIDQHKQEIFNDPKRKKTTTIYEVAVENKTLWQFLQGECFRFFQKFSSRSQWDKAVTDLNRNNALSNPKITYPEGRINDPLLIQDYVKTYLQCMASNTDFVSDWIGYALGPLLEVNVNCIAPERYLIPSPLWVDDWPTVTISNHNNIHWVSAVPQALLPKK